MKRILHIALLPILGVTLCGAADEGKSPFKHPVAAHFDGCPDGHKALVDVPIVWGHVGPLYKTPADYDDEDRALKLKEEKGEIVFGGCAFFNPPKTRVVCRQCGFSYDSMDMPEEAVPENSPVMAWWSKYAKTPEEFRIKFSEMLLSFPVLTPANGSTSYSQTLSANGKELDDESVSYRTHLTFDEALKGMRQWLIDHRRNPADLKPMELEPAPPADPFSSPNAADAKAKKSGPAAVQDMPGRRAYEYDDRTVWLTLRDDWYWNPGQVEISMRIRKAAPKSVHIEP